MGMGNRLELAKLYLPSIPALSGAAGMLSEFANSIIDLRAGASSFIN
jgi:hypothetical protein